MVLSAKKILIAVGAVVLGIALILLSVFAISSLSKNGTEEFSWNSIVLSSKLPNPNVEDAKVNYDSITQLDVKLNDVKFSFYEKYKDDCIKMGYTVDAEDDDVTYKASNEDGYLLMLYYSKTAGDMTVVLNNPATSGSNVSSKIADYVVEQGVSGEWNYRKWASGTVDCWGVISASIKDITEANNMKGMTYCKFELAKPSFVSDALTSIQVTPSNWRCIGAQATDYGTYFGFTVYGRTINMTEYEIGDTISLNIHLTGVLKDAE